jgi:hypothetical protein
MVYTTQNTDGYQQQELDRLNNVFQEVFEYVTADLDPDDYRMSDIVSAIHDAIANTDGNLTLVLDRFR